MPRATITIGEKEGKEDKMTKTYLSKSIRNDPEIKEVFSEPKVEEFKPEPQIIQPRIHGYGWTNCRRCRTPFKKRYMGSLYCDACRIERAKEEQLKKNRGICEGCNRHSRGLRISTHSGKRYCSFCLDNESRLLKRQRRCG